MLTILVVVALVGGGITLGAVGISSAGKTKQKELELERAKIEAGLTLQEFDVPGIGKVEYYFIDGKPAVVSIDGKPPTELKEIDLDSMFGTGKNLNS
jgi:hypothetical protein